MMICVEAFDAFAQCTARACELCFFFSSRRRHTRWNCDWSSDVCSSDLYEFVNANSHVPTRLPCVRQSEADCDGGGSSANGAGIGVLGFHDGRRPFGSTSPIAASIFSMYQRWQVKKCSPAW